MSQLDLPPHTSPLIETICNWDSFVKFYPSLPFTAIRTKTFFLKASLTFYINIFLFPHCVLCIASAGNTRTLHVMSVRVQVCFACVINLHQSQVGGNGHTMSTVWSRTSNKYWPPCHNVNLKDKDIKIWLWIILWDHKMKQNKKHSDEEEKCEFVNLCYMVLSQLW